MRALILAALLASCLSGSPGHRRSITINAGQITGTLTNFRFLFRETNAQFATSANGGFTQNPNGYDIRFWSDFNLTATIAHEMERYNATTGEVIAWVRCASCAVGTTIYMSYGDPAITTSQENPAGVWDANDKFVGHLPNGTTLTANDSTSNANHLTINGTPSAVEGQIDGAASFSTGSDMRHADAVSLQATSIFTLSAWVKPASYTGYPAVMSKARTNNANYVMDISPSGNLRGYFTQGLGNYKIATSTSTVSTISFSYVVVTYDGANIRTYINGAADGAATAATGAPDSSNYGFAVGLIDPFGGGGQPFTGPIDEPRFANVARSADWIAAEYNNQKTGSTFYTLGSQQSLAKPSMSPTFASNRTVIQ